MRLRYLTLLSVALTVLFWSLSQASSAQDLNVVQDRHLWFNVGAGGASVPRGLGDDDGGISVGVSGSYRTGRSLFSMRAVTNAEFKLNIWGNDSDPGESVWDIGALYGCVFKPKHFQASGSAGVSVVGGKKYRYSVPLHLGFPTEIQLFWTPFETLGFGFVGYADINSYKSFYGLLFCFQFCREL